jgi:hypothetical protein
MFTVQYYIRYSSSDNYSNNLDDGDYERSSLFVAGKFADFKRQHAHHSHAVDVPALPRPGLKPAALKTEDDWGRRRQEQGEEEDGNYVLRKRMGVREEETEAQSRMVEGVADEESDYEDYEEEDGEQNNLEKTTFLGARRQKWTTSGPWF